MTHAGARGAIAIALLAAVAGPPGTAGGQPAVPLPVVFVSRQIPPRGSLYWDVPRDMPGVGPWSRFRPAAPGRLIVREPDGALRVLVDGSRPAAASLQLSDVNAPDVSYDGRTIVFAGLPSGVADTGAVGNPGRWRLYTIRFDGSGLRPITTSDQQLDVAQFGTAGPYLQAYDDTDPAWLPDGRIVFSSTRWPSFAHYSGVRTSNLFVVNADGSGLHRITSERNGADRPLVDPLTGRIVFARWWRNHRFATDDPGIVPDPSGGYVQRDGLTTDRERHAGGSDALFRNAWQIAAINPDGTDLALWSGYFREEPDMHAYGGAFSDGGELYANFFPMFNMTEAAGFGGIRRFGRGPGRFTPVIGVTAMTFDYVRPAGPTSFGVFRGPYAGEPAVLPDGRLIVSWAADVGQDYGLYVVDADGSNRTPLYDGPGTTELRARIVRRRPLPPVIPDRVTRRAPALPPTSAPATFARGGTFVFDALNVYANAPIDAEIVSAPAVGSASTIRFYLDHQRTSPGSVPNLDWPILLAEVPVRGDGAVRHVVPADVPLFEQLRTRNGRVPLTRGPSGTDGAAHVAGMNYGRPGETVRCVGCHAGHSMLPVPTDPAEARWSNLAPGAAVLVSSSRLPDRTGGLTDRLVLKGEVERYWTSAPGRASDQWAQLTFPVPVLVRAVRLYNPRPDAGAGLDLAVQATRVTLFADEASAQVVARGTSGPLSVAGTTVPFDDVRARVVRVEIGRMSGTYGGAPAAGLAEIEVIAAGVPDTAGEAGARLLTPAAR